MSHNYMRNQMMDLLDHLSKVNIAQAPNYRMMIALRDSFENYGVPRATAERLVATMKISVSEQAVNDQELVRRVCETYGALVANMYRIISADFENSADDVLVSMAGQFSITMEF
jgi:hypothetical protein